MPEIHPHRASLLRKLQKSKKLFTVCVHYICERKCINWNIGTAKHLQYIKEFSMTSLYEVSKNNIQGHILKNYIFSWLCKEDKNENTCKSSVSVV